MSAIIAPETAVPLSAWLLLGPGVAIGFFLGGYLGFRWLPCGQPVAASFIASGLILFFAVLAADFFQLPLRREYLMPAAGGVALIGWMMTRRRPAADQSQAPAAGIQPRDWWRQAWWLAPVAIVTGSLLAHLILEPLSGYDNIFRWDYLARVMASQQSLQHYPPVAAEDFSVYPWCDGIPPMVPVLNLWLYFFTGSSAEIIGSLRAAVEFGLTLTLVWRLSHRLWGPTGAKVSLLVLATSALFLRSVSMAQETGLTGIALLTLAALLLDYREKPSAATAAWIGLAAGFAGLCRDYNLLFLPVTLGLLAGAPARRTHWWLTAGTMVATVAPWYLRNAWLTGNPLFPHPLGGLFPSNAAHVQTMREIQEFWSLSAGHYRPAFLLKSVLIGAGALFLAALPGLKPDRFERIVLVVFIVTTAALWVVSISSTAGGWFYSLRVLGPTLPLLAVAAGACAQAVKRRWGFAGASLCTLLAIDAARRSWVFIFTPTAPVLPYTWQAWSNWDYVIRLDRDQSLWAILTANAEGEGIVVDHPQFFVLGRRSQGNMVPMFSPQVEALWRADPTMDIPALRHALRQQHIRFVVLSGGTPREMYFHKSAPGIAKLLAVKPTVATRGLWIYDLLVMEQTAPSP
jgi:hypothetical protein